MMYDEMDAFKKHTALFMVERLKQNPQRIADVIALNNIQINRDVLVCKPDYLLAWDTLLKDGVDAIEDMVNEDSDRSQVLLSCSPLGALWESQEERVAFYRAFREKWAAGEYGPRQKTGHLQKAI